MPRVIITATAGQGLERCRRFLLEQQPRISDRASQAIDRQFLLLETLPEIGRPLPDVPELRELVIRFGDSGYVALYHYDRARDAVIVLAFRHQKEAGYLGESR